MGIGTPKSSTPIKAIIKKLVGYYSRSDLLQERKRVLRFYLLGDCSTDINYRLRQSLQIQDNKRGVIDNFIDSKHQSLMLMLGDAGAGKSAYTQWLVNYFCQNNNDETYPGFVPIRIELKAYNEKSAKDAINQALKNQFKFSEQEIAELKQFPDVVFLLDGYDEISGHSKINIYKENQCHINWPKAKVLITCRNGHFKDEAECKELFDIPAHKYAHPSDTSYADLLYLAPFDGQQIESYLDQFVKSSANFSLTTSDISHAKSLIKQHENLKVVVQNPFVLQIFAETFPNLLKKYGSDISKIVLSDIYEQFLEDWFIHAKERLKESINLSEISKRVTDLKRCFYNYAQAFAYELFAIGKVEIIYTPKDSHDEFEIQEYIGHKAFEHFFKSRDTNPKTVQESQKLLDAQRVACPLRRKIKDIDDEYSFIHKSYQDYLAANYLFTLIYDRYRSIKGQSQHKETKNVFKDILDDPNHVNHKKLLDVLNALNKRYLTEDRLVLRFLSERLEKLPYEEFESLSEELLLPMIQYSTKDKSYAKAASSIISALCAARKCMSGWDLRGVLIPKADLSRAILHRTNFANADLREIKFNQVYMAEANLSHSQMKDVQFGELPYLKFGEAVNCLSFSPDGKKLAIGQDNEIVISEVTTGKQLIVLQGHSGKVTSVAFSADGTMVVSGSNDKSVRLWDVKSGEELLVLQGHSYGVNSVAISTDGTMVASGRWDTSVRLWDAKSGKELLVLQGHSSYIRSVAISTDGSTVASGSSDGSVQLWDVMSGKELQVLQGHTGAVISVAFSAGGAMVASGSYDKSVRLWDAKSGKELQVLQGHSERVTGVAISSDGTTVVSGSYDNSVRLWDAKSGKELQVLNGHRWWIKSVAFSADGTTVVSGSEDKTVRRWDAKSGKELQVLQGHNKIVNSVARSSDSTTVVSASYDKSVRLWDAKSGKELQVLQGHSSDDYNITSLNGTTVASRSRDNSVRLLDAKSGKELQVLQGHSSWVTSVALSSDGSTVASGSWDKSVRLWDVKSGKELQVLHGHCSSVFSVVISTDGSMVASGSADKSVRLWDVKSGKELQVLHGHCSNVFSVAISTDGSMVASGSDGKSVRLWNVKSGKELQVLQGHTGAVISVAFSSGGAMVASGSHDKTIRIWDTTSYQCITVMVNGVSILSISFNTQGQLITGDESPNNSVRSWQLINHLWCLKWSSPQQILCLARCNIEDVKDLSDINRRLIEQRATEINLSLPLHKNKSMSALSVTEIPRKYSSTFEDDELSSAPTSIPLKPTAVTSEKRSSTTFTYQVNMRYEYKDSDINTILDIKVKDIPNAQGAINYVLGAVDNIAPNQLQRSIQTCIEELRAKPSEHNQYNLLIPFNLGCYHWVSLLIRLDANFKAIQTIYCDSLKRVTQIPESITTVINKLWPNIPVTLVELLTQPDMKSCGALAIVNLMNMIQERNERKKLTEGEVNELRRSDLLLLKDKRPAYFESFYQRQLVNRPSIAAIPEQVAMLSQEVKFSPQEYKRIMQGYELIKDIRDNNLKQILQACLKDKEDFDDKVHLYLLQIREGFNRVLSQKISHKDRDKENINKLISLFFVFEPGETLLTDLRDNKFRLEHEELRMLGKLLNGEDITSLTEFTQAVDTQIKADDAYAKKLQEKEYQRISRLIVSSSSQLPEKILLANSANPISPNAPPNTYAAPSSSEQSPQDIKRSAKVGAKGKLIGGNKADYARLRLTANDLIKLIPDHQQRLAYLREITLATFSDSIAQKPSGTVSATNNLLQLIQSLDVEGIAISGDEIDVTGIEVVPETRDQPLYLEVKELINKFDELLYHVKILSAPQSLAKVDVAAKPMLPFWKSQAIPLITIDEKLRQLFSDLKEESYNFTVTLVSGLISGTKAKIVIQAIIPKGLNEKRAARDLNGLKSDVEKSLKTNGYNEVSLITEEDSKTINVTAEPAVLQLLYLLLCDLAQKKPDEIPEDKDEKEATYNCIIS